MLACICPAYSSSNHTINTLRYSDRLKEKGKTNFSSNNNLNNVNNNVFMGVNNAMNTNNIAKLNEDSSNKKKVYMKEELTKEKKDRNIKSARVIKKVGKEEIKVKQKKDMVFDINKNSRKATIDESEVKILLTQIN